MPAPARIAPDLSGQPDPTREPAEVAASDGGRADAAVGDGGSEPPLARALLTVVRLLDGLVTVEGHRQWQLLGSRFPGGCPPLVKLNSEARGAGAGPVAVPEPSRADWLAAVEACTRACTGKSGAPCSGDRLEPALRALSGPALSTLVVVAADLERLLRQALAFPSTAPLVDRVRRSARRLQVDVGWPEQLDGLRCAPVRRLGKSELPRLILLVDQNGAPRLSLHPVASLEGGVPRLRGDARWRYPGKVLPLDLGAARLREELEAAGAAAAELQPVEPIPTSAPQADVGLHIHRELTIAQVEPLLTSLYGAGRKSLSLLACAGGRVGPLPGDAVRLAQGPLRRMPLVRLSPASMRTPEKVEPLQTWGDLVAAVQGVGLPVRDRDSLTAVGGRPEEAKGSIRPEERDAPPGDLS